jgi:murein DD-endopeptidase MepM/ murein hydrolase activator NlpD
MTMLDGPITGRQGEIMGMINLLPFLRALQKKSPDQSQQGGSATSSQNPQSGSGTGFMDRVADTIYGPPPPPPQPPAAPGLPQMQGVNPVTGQPFFSRNPKGEAGNERPGVGGAGNFGAPRGTAAHRRTHQGEDISGALGANIHAATDGTVIYSGVNGSDTTGYGNMVTIDDGNGTITRYAHNQDNMVRVGDKVKQGDVIATLGQTGNASELDPSEAHVHFEVEQNGQRVDPATWLNSAIAATANQANTPAPSGAQPRPAAPPPKPSQP